MTNLDIIRSTYDGDNSEENAENLMRYLADDVQWTEAIGFPYAGTYIGKQAVADQVFARLAREWDSYQVHIERYICQGDDVIALGSYSGVFKQTGRAFNARVAHHWQLQAGRIIRFEQFVDSLPVVEVMQ